MFPVFKLKKDLLGSGQGHIQTSRVIQETNALQINRNNIQQVTKSDKHLPSHRKTKPSINLGMVLRHTQILIWGLKRVNKSWKRIYNRDQKCQLVMHTFEVGSYSLIFRAPQAMLE